MDYINNNTLQVVTHNQVTGIVGASIPVGEAYGEWFPIMPSNPPASSPTTIVSASDPVKVNDSWVYGWSVRDKTEEELSTDSDRLVAAYTTFLEGRYDEVAAQRKYDNRLTCALRAAYPGPFQAEGIEFGSWMDTCNMLAYSIMSLVISGEIEMPTQSELWEQMPILEWPQPK